MQALQQLAVLMVTFSISLTFTSATASINVLQPISATAGNGRGHSTSSHALRYFFRKMGKRGSALNKCDEQTVCGMLQLQPGSTSYWTEEICSCGEDVPACSLQWDEESTDGKSITNSDTQLKLCRSINTFPTCLAHQIAVTSTMETSVSHPMIKQAASVFCNCPKTTHEFKLEDAGMVDEGERTVVSAHFGCIPVEHCRTLQPCKFLAILPTGDSIIHQNCECQAAEKCPRDISTHGIIPAVMDEITYYPFFCH